ncbi:MAG: hypothetical protein ACRDWD_12015 [Acidimicrobiia bacterium]
MAEHDLKDEFQTTHQRVSLGDRALVAIAAHVEVRSILRADGQLRGHGLDDVLIGSYARRVSIWPGKDVDVFGRLTTENVGSIIPDTAYLMFGTALQTYADQGRLTPQARSFKVDFGPTRVPGEQYIRAAAAEYRWESRRVKRVLDQLGQLAFAFSVDVVPAVAWGEHFGIPEVGRHEPTGERYRTGKWQLTNPVELTRLTRVRNRAPRIGGIGAYVRTVRSVKQVKAHHLPDIKPSALFYEFILYDGFTDGAITGASWADLTASALAYIADKLRDPDARPVCDPVLRQPYQPVPCPTDLATASGVFDNVARGAARAVRASTRCQAAIEWRQVFGGNEQRDHVFPLPPGCRGTGVTMGAAAANIAAGGTAERSFGDR